MSGTKDVFVLLMTAAPCNCFLAPCITILTHLFTVVKNEEMHSTLYHH